MTYIKWRESYNIGFKEVDDQHQKLVEILNELYEAHSSGTSKLIIDESLKKMIDYTKYHFTSEEKIMENYSYPEIEKHRGEHSDFTNKIDTLKKEMDNNNLLISLKTLDFLKDWTINHILGSDKDFGEFVREIETGA